MYHSRKKMYAVIVVLLCMIPGVFYINQALEKDDRLNIISQKTEEMGKESFQLALWSPQTENNTEMEIHWWFSEENERYYLFLPSGDKQEFYYLFNDSDGLWIGEEWVQAGDRFLLSDGVYDLKFKDNSQCTLEIMYSKNVASLYINTAMDDLEFLHQSKENTDTASYLLLDQSGMLSASGKIKKIHCRGNMTFDAADKKSYNINLEEKTALLDLGIGKKWALLANDFDQSLSRNQMVANLSNAMDMAYAPNMDYVDLYINGEYQGIYQLAEKVEISQERLNIRNLEKEMKALNKDLDMDLLDSREEAADGFYSLKWVEGLKVPENSKDGYLLELDLTYRYNEEKCGFITSREQPVVVKSPENVSYDQLIYVAKMYQDMEDCLCTEDGYHKEAGLYYYDYLDMYSFAQKYLIDEFSKNLDAALTSFYMYISGQEEKFFAGPVWDYDRTFGVEFERSGVDLMDPETFYVCENIYYDVADVNFFYLLCQKKEFKEVYQNLYWNGVRDIMAELAEHGVDENAEKIESSAMMDAVRWKRFGEGLSKEERLQCFYEENNEIKDFMIKRIAFFDREWK